MRPSSAAALLLALIPSSVSAGPIAFGDVVVMTEAGVVRLDARNGYAPDAPISLGGRAGQMDVAPDGSVYIVDLGSVIGPRFSPGGNGPATAPVVEIPHQIIELAPDGTERTFIPTGARRTTSDGEEFDSILIRPGDVSVAPDGSLYIVDRDWNHQSNDFGGGSSIVRVDPFTGKIVGSTFVPSPNRVDIGPSGLFLYNTAGGLERRWVEPHSQSYSPRFVGASYTQGVGAVLRDDTVVALVFLVCCRTNPPDLSEQLPALLHFDNTGLLIGSFRDYDPLAELIPAAGGIGNDFFFKDTPTSIARFDLDSWTWARIYDAGAPIGDVAVQQHIPEPGSLGLLAGALAVLSTARARRNTRCRQ